MSVTRAKKLTLFSTLCCSVISITGSSQTFADSSADSSATPAPAAIPAPGTGAAETVTSSEKAGQGGNAAGESAPATSPATPAASAPNATTTTSATNSASATETAPGPLLEKRKLVLSKIMAAKKQGTGISGYLAEYNRIEDMVKGSQPTSAYEERLTSLQTGIDEQLKRSQLLKTQRPTAPYTPSSSSGGSQASASHHGNSGAGGGISADTINDLKAKYGNKIPSDISSKIGDMSPEQREKLLNSDMLKKFLNK